ncbi:MAG: hypothetical protein RLZZ618_1474 [Pseudomonadota bacterium]|jgi:pimeloyl-ACP methyl ester carboxylesterase
MLLSLGLGLGSVEAATPAAPRSCTSTVKPVAASARLDSLAYRCERLADGQPVWIGEAGTDHPTTVLLVHGLGDSAHRDWRRVIPALAAGFHVITLDLPGFGASPPLPQGYSFDGLSAALKAVLDRTAPGQRVHVVGHSLGAAVSLHFAHRHPDSVDRLVLVDAAGILLNTVFARNMAQIDTPSVGIRGVDNFLQRFDDRVNGFSNALIGGFDSGFDFSRWLARNPSVRNAMFGQYTQVEAALGLVEHDFTPEIRGMGAPTTLIWGELDRVAPLRTGRVLAARLRDARLFVLDGVGHVPMNERPAHFITLLEAALSGPLSARGPTPVPGAAQGTVSCKKAHSQRYSGHISRLQLTDCQGARLSNAKVGELVLVNSSITLEDVEIDSPGIAIDARRSQVSGTVVQIKGRIGIQADNSTVELAGATLHASEKAVDMRTPSRVYFSVSEVQAPDHTGNAHFIWPATSPR